MSLVTARFVVNAARRLPDPNFKKMIGLERYIFVVPVRHFPRDLPLDPNARSPKISRRVYKEVEASLLSLDESTPGTFHLKNKGVCIIAHSVKQIADDQYDVVMQSGIHGIVDGGHTSRLIEKNLDNPDLPDDQYVTVEVRVGVPEDWIPEIAGGLNTSVQVQDMSLDNLSGLFSWIKEELNGQPYKNKIAWSENDAGDFDARDIISLLVMFNIELFPNNGDEHPVYAYEKKSTALKTFEKYQTSFERMKDILRDVLRLHDTISFEYRDIWNKGIPNGKAGSLAWSDTRKKGKHEFPFISRESEVKMVNGALYPILAAFRWYVVKDPVSGKLVWKDSYEAVVAAWKNAALALLKATAEMNHSLGRNPQSVGKSRPHWSNLHNIVAKKDLEARASAAE